MRKNKAFKLTEGERFALERAAVPYLEKWDHWTYAIGEAHCWALLKRLALRGLIERYQPNSYEYRLTDLGYEVLCNA